MSPVFSLEQESHIKQAFKFLNESQSKLLENLNEIRRLSNQPAPDEKNPSREAIEEPDQSVLINQLADLKKQVRELNKQLEKVQVEKRELIRRLKNIAFLGSREIYKAIGQEYLYPPDIQKKEIENLKKSIETINKECQEKIQHHQNKNQELQVSFDNISGAYQRTRDEKDKLEVEIEEVKLKVREAEIIQLIKEIGVVRLANLLDMSLDESDLEKEKLRLAERVIDHLRNFNLIISHKVEQQVSVSEKEVLSTYDLDEEYEEDALYLVTTPGFTLDENLIIKPHIKKQGDL